MFGYLLHCPGLDFVWHTQIFKTHHNMLSPTILLQLSLSDMDRVLEERWLSDASVNAYLDLVQV